MEATTNSASTAKKIQAQNNNNDGSNRTLNVVRTTTLSNKRRSSTRIHHFNDGNDVILRYSLPRQSRTLNRRLRRRHRSQSLSYSSSPGVVEENFLPYSNSAGCSQVDHHDHHRNEEEDNDDFFSPVSPKNRKRNRHDNNSDKTRSVVTNSRTAATTSSYPDCYSRNKKKTNKRKKPQVSTKGKHINATNGSNSFSSSMSPPPSLTQRRLIRKRYRICHHYNHATSNYSFDDYQSNNNNTFTQYHRHQNYASHSNQYGRHNNYNNDKSNHHRHDDFYHEQEGLPSDMGAKRRKKTCRGRGRRRGRRDDDTSNTMRRRRRQSLSSRGYFRYKRRKRDVQRSCSPSSSFYSICTSSSYARDHRRRHKSRRRKRRGSNSNLNNPQNHHHQQRAYGVVSNDEDTSDDGIHHLPRNHHGCNDNHHQSSTKLLSFNPNNNRNYKLINDSQKVPQALPVSTNTKIAATTTATFKRLNDDFNKNQHSHIYYQQHRRHQRRCRRNDDDDYHRRSRHRDSKDDYTSTNSSRRHLQRKQRGYSHHNNSIDTSVISSSSDGTITTSSMHRSHQHRPPRSIIRNHKLKNKRKDKKADRHSESSTHDDSYGHFEGGSGTVILNRYKLLKDVGMGTFGRVVEAIDLRCRSRSANDDDIGRRKRTTSKGVSASAVGTAINNFGRKRDCEAYSDVSCSQEAWNVNKQGRRGQEQEQEQQRNSSSSRCHNQHESRTNNRNSYNSKTVAIKIVRKVKRYYDSALIEAEILREVNKRGGRGQALCAIMHDSFDFHGHYCLVFECLGRSLYDFMKEHKYRPFPFYCVREFARQLLDALDFLHGFGLIHTDLKPENILLTDNRERTHTCSSGSGKIQQVPYSTAIKVIDFGGATYDFEKKSCVVNTRQYRAPEVILGLGWSTPSDLWSLGCILAELYVGELLFATHDNVEHLALMERTIGRFPYEMIWGNSGGLRGSSSFSSMSGKTKFQCCSITTAFDTNGWHRMGDVLPTSSLEHVMTRKSLDSLIWDEDRSSGMGSLLRFLLVMDPRSRKPAGEVLKLPVFN